MWAGPSAMRPIPRPIPTLKETGLKAFHGYLKQIDEKLAGREWFGDKYSVVDPYGFVFYTWGVRRELPMGELKNYTAFKDRMMARPAVQRVRGREGQGLLVICRAAIADARERPVGLTHRCRALGALPSPSRGGVGGWGSSLLR